MVSPFHEGEVKMQFLTGESRGAALNAPMIASRIAKGAGPFLSARQFAALAIESGSDIWCTGVFGKPGFASAAGQSRLSLNLQKLTWPVDPMLLDAAERRGSAGSIFIDLQTRMRYRINGTLMRPNPGTVEIQVQEAYGNCPKYITRRTIQWDTEGAECAPCAAGESLPSAQQDILRNADLFFMATGHPSRGLDASHRGGFPGFVTVVDERTLVFPDYPGNSLFNSLGNLMVDHRIGLLVPDLARGKAIRITGTAVMEFQDSTHHVTTADAPRLVKVTISRWDEISFPVYSSKLVDYSPFNP